LANYGLSADSGRRDRFSACAEQLKAAPFGFETLEVIADKGSFYPAFDDDMSRSRQVGIGALDALALVGSLFLEQPDILLVDSPGGAWSTGTALREWLEKTLEQDRAPCEQVFWVGDCL
jgi:hypothetical protein